MFYLIIGILILLFYLFAAPSSIKGTFNAVGVVFLLVVLLILLVLAIFKVFQLPSEYFLTLAMVFLGYYGLRDLRRMPVKRTKR